MEDVCKVHDAGLVGFLLQQNTQASLRFIFECSCAGGGPDPRARLSSVRNRENLLAESSPAPPCLFAGQAALRRFLWCSLPWLRDAISFRHRDTAQVRSEFVSEADAGFQCDVAVAEFPLQQPRGRDRRRLLVWPARFVLSFAVSDTALDVHDSSSKAKFS